MPTMVPFRLSSRAADKKPKTLKKDNENDKFPTTHIRVASEDEQNNISHVPLPTHLAGIGNMDRTQFEGFLTPTQYKEQAHLKTVAPLSKVLVTKRPPPVVKQKEKEKEKGKITSDPSPVVSRKSSKEGATKVSSPTSNQYQNTATSSRHRSTVQESQVPGITIKMESYSPAYGVSGSQYTSKVASQPSIRAAPLSQSQRKTSTSRAPPPSSRPPSSTYNSKTPLKSQAASKTRTPPSQYLITNGTPQSRSHSQSQAIGVPPTQHQNALTNKTSQPQYPYSPSKALPKIPISQHGPISISSIHTTPASQRMASLQPKITSLPPAQRSKQEAWAQSIIASLARTTCPEGNKFERIDSSSRKGNVVGGYQCSGGRHFLTDDLVAMGVKGAVYYLLDPRDTGYCSGPYFPSQQDKGTLLYSGSVPKVPPHALDWIRGPSKGNFNPKTNAKEPVTIGRTILSQANDRDILDIARVFGVVGLSAEAAREKCEAYVGSGGGGSR